MAVRRRPGATHALVVAVLLLSAGCVSAPARPATRGELLERVLPATVQVTLEQDGQRVRSGSGVVLARRLAGQDADCYVVTTAHTLAGLAGSSDIYVWLDRHRGRGRRLPARVLARGESAGPDVALLEVHAPGCGVAQLGEPPVLGEAIWVVAFPWGRHMTLVGGIVSQLELEPGDGESPSRLMVDAPVSYGASGGGVFDAETGRLIGVIEGYRTARVSFQGDAAHRYIDVPVPGETYVTPLADIRRFLGEAGFAYLLDGTPGPPRGSPQTRRAR